MNFGRRTAKDAGGCFIWNDSDPRQSLGPGLSRPRDGEKTRMWHLQVKPRHQSVVKLQVPAATEELAVKYALARWPEALITVVCQSPNASR